MKKLTTLMALILAVGMTGCCTYQKSYNIDNGMEQEQAQKQYKNCLASELLTTIKFWIGMQNQK